MIGSFSNVLVWEVQSYFWDISFWHISRALQFKTSVLFVIVLLIPELLMHTVPSFTDGLFRILAKIEAFPQLDDFQDKPWPNRANYFLCFHWEASKLKAISPAHLPKTQAPAGVVALTVSCVPTPQCTEGPHVLAWGKANSFISVEVFQLVLIKDMMKALLVSQNLNFKYVVGAGVEVSV